MNAPLRQHSEHEGLVPVMKHPLPAGSRVHHRGCLWNYGFTEKERQDRPSWGWATVLEAVPQHNRTVEYRVAKDAPLIPDGDAESWWASYHIDRAEIRELVPENDGKAA